MPKRVDANQTACVALYRKLGCSVAVTSAVGRGFPDIVVGTHGVTDLVEIKDGTKAPSRRKLTKDEHEFHMAWKGSIALVQTEEHVIGHVHEMRQRGSR